MNRWRFLPPIALAVAVGLGVWLARGALLAQEKPVPARPAVVWEYKIMDQVEVSRLGDPDFKQETGVTNLDALRKGFDKLGTEGWELAAVEGQFHPSQYYFKRLRAAK
jgi:hypothetical protein